MEKDFIKAGKISAEALQYGQTLVKPGAKVREILDKVENKILQLGGEIAFPAQISLNEFAAHSCASLSDETILEEQIVKLDVGAHVNGQIGDNALTVDLSKQFTDLVKASREALNNALKITHPGIELGEIGKTIQETIESYGYSPIKNLAGHGLGEFEIHTYPSVPNYNNGNNNILEEGMTIAIEPFASTGAGVVVESSPANVFNLVDKAGVRDPITRKIQDTILAYNGLPFARRWLEKEYGVAKVAFALRNLKHKNVLQEHPPLFDQHRGMVSQAEHTILIKEKPIITTKF
jgi:methionyl aminopeptidase